jgi:LysR family glycine cleavage system transcriptional activator
MSRQALLPSINDLLAFETAARHGSFTRAAAELNLTQSAVSRNVRVLEETLGIPLFERVRQRVVLTAAGAVYMQDAQRILNDLRDATHRAMAFGDLTTVMNIAVLPTFASRWLMPRLPGFMKRNPDVTINFSARLQPFSFGLEPFDAAIHYGKPAWPGGVMHHLMDETMVVVASPEYLEDHKIKSPSDLKRATLLHLSTRPMAWSDWFESAGIDSAAGLKGPRYEQFSMLSQAAQAGMGIALLPSMFITDEIDVGDLVTPFDISLSSESCYYWVVPEEKGGSGALQDLTQWLLRSTAGSDRRPDTGHRGLAADVGRSGAP